MKKYLCSGFLVISISCGKVQEDYDEISDSQFVLEASMANSAGVDIGVLASRRATDDSLKDFALTTVDYYTGAQNQLKTVALTLNLYAPDSLDAEHEALRYQLLDLFGRAFDSVYVHNLVKDYQNTIQLLLRVLITENNAQLRDYSASLLTKLELYLQRAQGLASNY